ncbi:MAG: hypothetical protein IJO32_00235 [Bacilli bacterium]|nr:hypothetical protein [Bacilli bacterium]
MKNIELKIINKEKLNDDEIIKLLDYIVSNVRKIVNDETFTNKCDLTQGLIGRYLNTLNIKNNPCITNKSISDNIIGHSFIIADFSEYGNKKYIIDPSYIQFLYSNDKDNDIYINDLRVKSKSPFYYAHKINKDITNEFLKNGYMELNEENAFLYGNSFYKTKTGIPSSYEIPLISGKVYMNSFIKGNEILRKYDYKEIETSIKTK